MLKLFFHIKIHWTIVPKLEKFRPNIIYLEKGKWLDNCEAYCLAKLRNNDFKCVEPYEDKVKKMDITDSEFKGNLTSNIVQSLTKFTSLVKMKQNLQIVSIETNFFSTFKNLSKLQLDLNCVVNFPEFLFTELVNLDDLDLNLSHKVKLNKNHFKGLENLRKLKVTKAELDEDFEPLSNLEMLTLQDTTFNNFTLKFMKKLDFIELNFKKQRPLFKCEADFIENLRNLSSLKTFNFEHPLDFVTESQKEIFDRFLTAIPANVKASSTHIRVFNYITENSIGIPFIKGLKDLELILERYVKIKDSNLFKEDFYQNLESLNLNGDLLTFGDNILDCKKFTPMKKLNNLQMFGFILDSTDADFNYLTKASFNVRTPENILNFSNLESLCMSNFYERIILNESYLEGLVNLKDLCLNVVFGSIDSNVQYLFKSLTKLTKLNLDYNNTKIIKSSYLDYLVDLQELNLQANNIKIIEPGSFKNLSKLKSLYLYGNILKEFANDMFYPNVQPEICFSEHF